MKRTPVGLIRTDEDARASLHIGVLYEVSLKSEDVALSLNQKEFRLVEICRISEFYDSMGDWWKSIVNHYWPAQAPSAGEKPTLFAEPDSVAE